MSIFTKEDSIEKACELLRGSELKVNDIGSLVGYPNAHHFSSLFKKSVGCPPTAYCDKTQKNTRQLMVKM